MKKCPITNKTVFMSLTAVEIFMQQGDRRQVLRHYLCDHCNYYHVTSMSSQAANSYFGVKPLKYADKFKKYLK